MLKVQICQKNTTIYKPQKVPFGDITNHKFSFTFSITPSLVITEPNIISKDTKVFL